MARHMLVPGGIRRRADSRSPGIRAPKRDALHAGDGSDEGLAMARHGFQHHLNALHVMARLVRVGIPRLRALALARWWERAVHPLLYPALRPPNPVCVASPVRLAVRPGTATRDRVKGSVS